MRTPYLSVRHLDQSTDEEGLANKAHVVEKHERCTFCNSRLVFSHDLNLSFLQVIETSRCSGCGVTMLPKKFTLH